MSYLLDTNVCVFLLRDKYDIGKRIREVGPEAVAISEITVAELTFGAYLSDRPEHHLNILAGFVESTRVLAIGPALSRFGSEKARLRRAGTPVSDFDILIAVTALEQGLTMVTEDIKDLGLIAGIDLVNWVQR